jgi:hypothetical protein
MSTNSNVSDLYLYHGEVLYHRGFFKAMFNLRHGNYRSSPRILGHELPYEGRARGDFTSREGYHGDHSIHTHI